MKFIERFVGLTLVVACQASPYAQAPQNLDTRAKTLVSESSAAAEAALTRMRDSSLATLGIEGGTTEGIRLDAGLPIFWLTLPAVSDIASGKTALEAAVQNDDVVFPLMRANGSGATMMVMTRNDRGWQQAAVGRATLARTLVAARRADAERTGIPSDTYFAVEVPALQRIYLARGRGDATRIIVLDTDEALSMTAGDVLTVRPVMQALQKYYLERRKPQP